MIKTIRVISDTKPTATSARLLLVAYHVKQKIMKHLQKINEINSKITSLEYDRSQLNFINELQPKNEKNKLSDLIESYGCYFNDDEAVRIKICLQGIFLNRIQNTENELRKFKITENGL